MLHVRRKPLDRLLGVLTALVLLAGLALVTAVPGQAAAWSVPSFVQSMGGTGRAGIYAWGLDHNRVTDEVVVSDYQSFRVRRYSKDGVWLGDLPKVGGETWGVATDPRNGDIFVADNWGKQVHRYAKDGTFLKSWSTSALRYAAWLDVDTSGNVWIIDSADWSGSGQQYVNRFTPDGARLAQYRVTVPFTKIPTIFGIGVTGDGTSDRTTRIYLPDGNNQRIHVLDGRGKYLSSFGTATDGSNLLSADVRSMAVDVANSALYVSDAGHNQIEKFSLDGRPLGTWGSTANSATTIQAPRGLAVDPQGDLWAADYGNHRFREYAPDGRELGVHPNPSDAENPGHFGQARDVTVDPETGAVWVVDTANQRFTRLGASGAVEGVWGRRGFGDHGTNYPSTIAFEPTQRAVWVASEEGRYIKVYGADGSYRFIIGQQEKSPEDRGLLQNPTDIDFWDGKAYVSDEQNVQMQVFDVVTGAKLFQFPVATSAWSEAHGAAIDPATGDVFVCNNKDDRIDVYTATGTKKHSFGTRGNGDGQFQYPRDATVVDGVLYVTDSQVRRVQAFTLTGGFLGKWGGQGTGAHQFEAPTGIDADPAGRIYVSDMGLNRVTVFDTRSARPPYETVAPAITLQAPAEGQVFSTGPVRVRGSATDNTAVAGVEVAVQDVGTGLWFNGAVASWEPEKSWNIAPLTGRPASSVAFDYAFPSVRIGRDYAVEVRARDAVVGAGNTSASVVRSFRTAAAPTDTAPPETVITAPTATQLPWGAVAVEGTATGEAGISAVEVAVRRRGTDEWWQPGGGWGPQSWTAVAVSPPSGRSVTWSTSWTPTEAGEYDLLARSVDVAGRRDGTPSLRTVVVGAPDTTPPDATVTTPRLNAVVPVAPLTITGTVTDNAAVGAVRVAIRDAATGQWWQASGGWGAGYTLLPATVASPGAASTTWELGWTPPASGSFGVRALATDVAGNADPTPAWVPFKAG